MSRRRRVGGSCVSLVARRLVMIFQKPTKYFSRDRMNVHRRVDGVEGCFVRSGLELAVCKTLGIDQDFRLAQAAPGRLWCVAANGAVRAICGGSRAGQ